MISSVPVVKTVGDGVYAGSINADGFPDLVISASSEVGAVLLRSTGPAAWAVVDLPLGATEDRVVGALDLERALAQGIKAFEPGLLARKDRKSVV